MGGSRRGGGWSIFSEWGLQRQAPERFGKVSLSVSAKDQRAPGIVGDRPGPQGDPQGGCARLFATGVDMPTSLKEMLAAANAAVPKVSFEEAAALLGRDDVLVVDVRDAPELQSTGKIPGAMHVTRGMIEFRADPDLNVTAK
jgi:rhodanese-like protein